MTIKFSELDKHGKEAVIAFFKIILLSQHLPGRTVVINEIPQSQWLVSQARTTYRTSQIHVSLLYWM
jgi:hypothetical protein